MTAAITFLQSASDTTDSSTYTFASQNLGTASADRYIIVCIAGRRGNVLDILVSSVTVQGVSASLVVNVQNAATNSSVACIAIAAVPTGTTGDIVVNFPRTLSRLGISVFAATGIVPTEFDSDSSTADSPTCNLDIPAYGIGVGICNVSSSSSVAWSGLTERNDDAVEGSTFSAASDAFSATQTGLAITATITGTLTNPVGAFASFKTFNEAWARNSNVLIGM